MSEKTSKQLVTCALPYANGPIHIGHVAGCLLPSDIYVRHLREQGHEVMFVCGTDEHGVPITLRAKKEGSTPQEVVDRYYTQIKGSLEKWGLEFDNFSRTSREIHHQTAKEFFTNLYKSGVFEEKVTEQYFDPEAKQFLADRYIVGTCPNCGFEEAYGDQCEKCGRASSPQELINPKSALSGSKPILKETKNWYLPLDKIQDDFLNQYIESHKSDWKSHVYGQCMSWLKDGLKPRAMTRDLNWGVEVPVEGADGKVMYVWFDAPIGYISATREISEDWESWWKDPSTQLTHFIGKDNIVFHCIIFPAMLKSHGDYILPKNVPANEFLNLEGKKISTSRNYAVWLHEYLEDFPDRNDELRYVLTSIMPESKDADFSWADYQARVNNELVAILGNWVNRVVVLTHKYFDGAIPAATGEFGQSELQEIDGKVRRINSLTDSFSFREAQAELMNIARIGNKFLQETAPWHLIKEEGGESKVADILAVSLQMVVSFAENCRPYLPETSAKILAQLNAENGISTGSVIPKAQLLFQKIEDEDIETQKAKLDQMTEIKTEESKYDPLKDEIVYDDFAKMDLRVGTISSASKVPKADRLLQLSVEMGFETRTIVSGIAEHFDADKIIGQQVVVVCNLAPRKLRGILSQGMILMAEDEDGRLEFVSPGTAVANGAGVS